MGKGAWINVFKLAAGGHATVGDQVFIKGERIEGPAPSLPTVTGEV